MLLMLRCLLRQRLVAGRCGTIGIGMFAEGHADVSALEAVSSFHCRLPRAGHDSRVRHDDGAHRIRSAQLLHTLAGMRSWDARMRHQCRSH